MKGCTEALVLSAQKQALRTNYIKYHIDNTVNSPLCRMCSENQETVCDIVRKRIKLAQQDNKRRQGNVARYIHWDLCVKAVLERVEKWYKHKPDGVMENGRYK